MFKLILIIVLSMVSTSVFPHGMSAEDQARILHAGGFDYLLLGARHMLTGYDHLLFLFGVMFFVTNVRDIIKYVTAFTLGHSITLILATLFKITANVYLIDAVIALTVCYKAFDNLGGFKKYFQTSSPNLTAMVFIFGLVHGFGLATRLQELPLGHHGLVKKILSFNIGVEIGQIVALCIMLVILVGWRKTASFKRFGKAANAALMIAGMLLFLMQLHGYQHTQYADDFPLNTDDHYHVHEDMLKQRKTHKVEPVPVHPTNLAPDHNQTLKQTPSDSVPAQETHSHKGGTAHSH